MLDPDAPLGTPPSPVDAYRAGWAILLGRALDLLLVGVVWTVVSLPAPALGEGPLALVYNVLVLGPVNFGGMYAVLRAARGDRPEVGDLFAPFRVEYVQSVLGSLLVNAIVLVGFFLLVVPGIVAIVRLSWVPYLVVEGRRPAIDAVRESWVRTGPHAWTILGIELLAIPVILAGVFFFIVGVVPALVLAHLAAASFYAAIVPREEAPAFEVL